MAHPMLRADVDEVIERRVHGDEVDAERLRRARPGFGDSVSSRSGVIAPQAITPNAPALDKAETRLRSEIQLIAPPRTAYSQPRNSAPRAIRRFRRSWPMVEEMSLIGLRHSSASWNLTYLKAKGFQLALE